jgi:hypothetical protein
MTIDTVGQLIEALQALPSEEPVRATWESTIQHIDVYQAKDGTVIIDADHCDYRAALTRGSMSPKQSGLAPAIERLRHAYTDAAGRLCVTYPKSHWTKDRAWEHLCTERPLDQNGELVSRGEWQALHGTKSWMWYSGAPKETP